LKQLKRLDELVNQSPHRLGKSLAIFQTDPTGPWFVVVFRVNLDEVSRSYLSHLSEVSYLSEGSCLSEVSYLSHLTEVTYLSYLSYLLTSVTCLTCLTCLTYFSNLLVVVFRVKLDEVSTLVLFVSLVALVSHVYLG